MKEPHPPVVSCLQQKLLVPLCSLHKNDEMCFQMEINRYYLSLGQSSSVQESWSSEL